MASNHPGSGKIQIAGRGEQQQAAATAAGSPDRNGVTGTAQVTAILRRPISSAVGTTQKPARAVPQCKPLCVKQWKDYTEAEQATIRSEWDAQNRAAARGEALDISTLVESEAGRACRSPYMVAALRQQDAAAAAAAALAAQRPAASGISGGAAAAVLPDAAESECIIVAVAATEQQPEGAPAPFVAAHAAYVASKAEKRGWDRKHQENQLRVNDTVLEAVCAVTADDISTAASLLKGLLTGSVRVSGSLAEPMQYKCRAAKAGSLFEGGNTVQVALPAGIMLAVTRQPEPWGKVLLNIQGVPPDIADGDLLRIVATEVHQKGLVTTLQLQRAAVSALAPVVTAQSASERLGITEALQRPVSRPMGVARDRPVAAKRRVSILLRRDAAQCLTAAVLINLTRASGASHAVKLRLDLPPGEAALSGCYKCGHGHTAARCPVTAAGMLSACRHYVSACVEPAQRQQPTAPAATPPPAALEQAHALGDAAGFQQVTGNRKADSRSATQQQQHQ